MCSSALWLMEMKRKRVRERALTLPCTKLAHAYVIYINTPLKILFSFVVVAAQSSLFFSFSSSLHAWQWWPMLPLLLLEGCTFNKSIDFTLDRVATSHYARACIYSSHSGGRIYKATPICGYGEVSSLKKKLSTWDLYSACSLWLLITCLH